MAFTGHIFGLKKTYFILVCLFLCDILSQSNCTYINSTLERKYVKSIDYLINTPGCKIAKFYLDFWKTGTTKLCGIRKVFVEKTSEHKVRFIMKAKLKNCCNMFASRSTVPGYQDQKVIFSSCVSFSNGTEKALKEEVIVVLCDGYEDMYVIVKKVNKLKTIESNIGSFNVLMIGVQSMSSARAASHLTKTVNYMQTNGWIKYMAHNKVAGTTLENLLAVLSGNNFTNIRAKCKKDMSLCNDQFIWSKFRDAGYATAYGEDTLNEDSVFSEFNNGFSVPPTDHYIKPLYIAGNMEADKNSPCLKKKYALNHLLDYADDFMTTYQNHPFFGLFWIKSSRDDNNISENLLDKTLLNFLKKVSSVESLAKTFLIIFSDMGLSYGHVREHIASYYENRLPMMFIKVPLRYKRLYLKEFISIALNKNTLTTHYDLHNTLLHILSISSANFSNININHQSCPNCRSLSTELLSDRTCTELNIKEKFCACNEIYTVHEDDLGAYTALAQSVIHVNRISKKLSSLFGYQCQMTNIQDVSVLRTNYYKINAPSPFNRNFIVAFLVTPVNASFEAILWKPAERKPFQVMPPTEFLNPPEEMWKNCLKVAERKYCICSLIKAKVAGLS